MCSAMHHMAPSRHTSPASPLKLQIPSVRFNPITLPSMPSQEKHMNMPNEFEDPTLINGYTAQQTNLDASPKASHHTCHPALKPCATFSTISYLQDVKQHTIAFSPLSFPTKQKSSVFDSQWAATLCTTPKK
jgi:hypothetical protein